MAEDKRKSRIGIVGTGTVGTALALALHKRGYRIACLHDRLEGRAFSLAQTLSAAVHSDVEGIAQSAETVFLTVPDDSIAAVAKEITWRRGNLAVHCSGAVSLDALESARQAGGDSAGFHPLQSFADAQGAAASLGGSTVAIEAEGSVRELLFSIAYDIGMQPFYLNSADRAVYHTAAVIAGNFCTTLLHVASFLVRGMESSPDNPSDALARLMVGAIDNAVRLGPAQGLTGPYARGDVGTVMKHVEALKEKPKPVRSLYTALARITLELGLSKSTMTAGTAARIDALIDILETIDEDDAEK